MCGIVGVYDPYGKAGEIAVKAAEELQHRGQDGAGLFLNARDGPRVHKGAGFVHEVFHGMDIPSATIAISHVRYGTQGASDKKGKNQRNAAPLEIIIEGEMRGAIAHNGDLVGAMPLLEAYQERRKTDVDTELFVLRFEDSNEKGLVNRVRDALMPVANGAYSMVGIFGDALFAFRDPLGIRPLMYGKRMNGTCIIASESQALEGCQEIRDIGPGMMLILTAAGKSYEQIFATTRRAHCAFEHIYYSSPAAETDGIWDEGVRQHLGKIVAGYIDEKPDVIIPVPDSGNSFGMSLAYHLKVRPVPGLLRNHYMGRNFIVEGNRQELARKKLRLNKKVFRGAHVLFADDSIVRGDTSKELAGQAYDAGARLVDIAVSYPLWSHLCNMGINTHLHRELLGYRAEGSLKNAASLVGVRRIYVPTALDVRRAMVATAAMNGISRKESDFCMACVDGIYPIHSPLMKAIPAKAEEYAGSRSV